MIKISRVILAVCIIMAIILWKYSDFFGDTTNLKDTNTSDLPIVTDSRIMIDYNQESKQYCSLTLDETFNYLYESSPFKLGNSGRVNFSKRFSYENDRWVENKITITGGNGLSRLEGEWQLIGENKIRVKNLIATNGLFDASRNNATNGILIINCDGDITGVLSDTNGNVKDIFIKK
jgi:hypothetical protein